MADMATYAYSPGHTLLEQLLCSEAAIMASIWPKGRRIQNPPTDKESFMSVQ